MIIRNREDIGKIDDDVLNSVLREHYTETERFDKLDRMYRWEHSILKRELADAAPNNRVVCNYAKYISDMAVGYLLGKPISYRAENEDDIREMQRRFNAANMANTDAEIAKDMSILGKAEELIYMSDDDIPIAKSINIDPRNAFVVYDDTIENRKIFGVYYYPRYDLEGRIREYVINVYTKDKHYKYLCGNIFDRKKTLAEENRIYFCDVPMIEYLNNEEEQGDFEQVTSLIDAYNILQSDRINDVERFVQAILF
ncbi:MAG: phage portal protein, partial [Firmicutes bacterium]|nr:phage portal protein [Bacillota bacterium]